MRLDPQLGKFCKLDIGKFCKEIPRGEGKIVECLKKRYEVSGDFYVTVLFGFLVFVHCQPGVRDGLVVRCFKHSVRFNIRKGKQTQTLKLKSFR